MENQEKQHKRRVRYAGTHPRNYKEKYKEHNPEKYADTIEKVIRKGGTPAGMHRSIMVEEILEFLQIQPGQTGVDATLGYGGHTKKMLECLRGQGHIYGLDVDPIESAKTKERLANQGFGEEILTVRLQNFADIDQVSRETGKKFDFVLADLGVSSMQIDNPDRGFSYKVEGPLDLRMNPEKGISAAGRLKTISGEELTGMLVENADEPYAEEITEEILKRRTRGRAIETTTQLKEAIEEALRFLPKQEQKEAVKKSCQRTFQALRIDINSEFEVLYAFLEKLPEVLAPDGRVAILTFHSGEDRLVKKSFKELQKKGIYREISGDVIRPSAEECAKNSRARSTKMRWAIRSDKALSGEIHTMEESLEQPEKKILVLDACVRREESRTRKLMDRAVQTLKRTHPHWQFDMLSLMDLDLKYLNTQSLKERDALLAKKEYDAPMFAYGNQFREADGVIVAAPFWDLSIPAVLKVYIENISAEGITFGCGPEGLCGLCKAQWMLFLTTRGGIWEGSDMEQGSRYMEAMSRFFGIDRYFQVYAEGIDIDTLNGEEILEKALLEVEDICRELETERT